VELEVIEVKLRNHPVQCTYIRTAICKFKARIIIIIVCNCSTDSQLSSSNTTIMSVTLVTNYGKIKIEYVSVNATLSNRLFLPPLNYCIIMFIAVYD
jgi:hypothetical protein